MELTKDFRETPQFRKALLREAIELLIAGEVKGSRAILRNYAVDSGHTALIECEDDGFVALCPEVDIAGRAAF